MVTMLQPSGPTATATELETIVRQVLGRMTIGTLPTVCRLQGVIDDAQRVHAPIGRREMVAPLGVSNRHMHLSQEHVELLFGEGYELRPMKELYQPGYFATQDRVLVVGKRRCLEGVAVLIPLRPKSQVELSKTDALTLGLELGVAESGTDPASQPILLVGPKGQVILPGGQGGGAYIARRHVHMSPAEAVDLGVRDGDLLDAVIGGPRPTTYHGVLVRTGEGWRAEVHLDTDEANAAGLRNGDLLRLVVRERGNGG